MVEPKKIREETLVPGHGQDFNTLFFALPEMNPKLRYEMIGPEFIL